MNLEIQGTLIECYPTNQVNDRFSKREFVLEIQENVNESTYTNYAVMQLTNKKCDLIDRFQMGDTLKVQFSIKGNRVERNEAVKYFSNLEAWRIEKA